MDELLNVLHSIDHKLTLLLTKTPPSTIGYSDAVDAILNTDLFMDDKRTLITNLSDRPNKDTQYYEAIVCAAKNKKLSGGNKFIVLNILIRSSR